MEEERRLMTGMMTTGKERIFFGGLGESITSDDLRKIFLPLGRIEAIEIIRSKGRSFAYIDFFPSSDKSLSKLFSTYNGCRWKGGKLRLEKAKEHFLARLRREWDEDAHQEEKELMADNSDAGKEDKSSETKSKPPVSEVEHLNIFFPRLRKVKSVPFRGTGKHKYSFRRVEVPALPVHFCDCEEHSRPPSSEEPAGGGRRNGINEQEIKLANSAFDHLSKRENIPNNVSVDDDFARGEDPQLREREDGELVLNIAGHFPETSLDVEQSRSSNKGSATGVTRKKMKLDPQAAGDACNNGRNKNKKIGLQQHENQGQQHENQGQQHENQGQQQLEKKEETTRSSSRGSAWLHQSSWIQLMNSNSSFSISQILPNMSSQIKEPVGDTRVDEVRDSAPIDRRSVAEENDNSPVIVEQESKRIPGPTREARMGDVALVETCSFVRTAASLREWSRTKAALTGSLKKTKNGNFKESRTGKNARK